MPQGLRELKKARTRDTIVDTTVALIRERGYDGTTVEEIARRAEVTTPTFYNYFASKEAVLGHVYVLQMQAWATTIEEHLEQDVSTKDRLHALVARMAEGMLEDAALWKSIVAYGDVNPIAHPDQAEAETLAEGSLRALVETGQQQGELRGDCPPELLAAVFDGAMLNLCYGWAAGDVANEELEPAFQSALDICLHGMTA